MPEADHHLKDSKPAVICTASGVEFDLLNPTPDMINWKDMSEALGKCVRFSGHCEGHYSVARHSVIMARTLINNGLPEYALEALLHDSAEAYLGDCATPLKALLPRFKEIENNILRVVYEKAGLAVGASGDPVSETIHDADWQLFLAEWQSLMPDVRWVDYPAPRDEWNFDVRYLCTLHGLGDWQKDSRAWLTMLYDLLPLEVFQRAIARGG